MLRRFATSCLPIALAVGVIGAVGATAVPASAAASTTGITVVLKSHDTSGLRRLASAHGLSHAARMKALRQLLPSAAQHRKVADALRAAGLEVTNETAWSVSATGSNAAVSNTFGSHPVMRAHATPAQRRAAAGPYSALPASMDGAATAAYPTASGPDMFHHHAPDFLLGSDFRNAYTSSDLTARGQAPYGGSDPAADLTIATLQLAAWNPDDLETWANTDGIGVPGYNPATDLTMVPVDQPSVPDPTADDDGTPEVDLDQEAILSTDPYAHQRPYFAPNTAAGYFDALAQVLDDVMQDSYAYQGGDPNIVALSTSWGLCELDTGEGPITAMEPVLTSLLAAGVTIFASSGDDGIYDQCSTSGPHVDYPASSPEVIGVGGTSLSPVGSSAPNDGTNWTESAWSCTGTSDCQANGGSGGGVSGDEVSAGFTRPPYQSLIQGAPFAQATQRMVPDISAHADPDTGFPVYTSAPSSGEGYYLTGGTSLAAPVSAALFTNALAAHAVKYGAVDVLPALYTAAVAGDGSFRDVTSGSNGASADVGSGRSVDAAPGYDTVTGLGAPLWPKIVDRVLDPLAWPKASGKLTLSNPRSAASKYRVTASWTGSPARGGLAVDSVAVRIARVGHSGAVYSRLSAPADGSYAFTAKPGSTYLMAVTSRDLAGTTSITKTSRLVVPIDDRDLSFVGPWQRKSGSGDFGGSIAQTSHRNAAATVRASGKAYSLLVHTGPSYGKLVVSQGGHQVKVINLHARRSETKLVTFFRSSVASDRRFDFICRGSLVNVDAVYAKR